MKKIYKLTYAVVHFLPFSPEAFYSPDLPPSDARQTEKNGLLLSTGTTPTGDFLTICGAFLKIPFPPLKPPWIKAMELNWMFI